MFPSSYHIQFLTLLSVNHIEHTEMESLILKLVAEHFEMSCGSL